jgi:multidrug efflux pump subunit AcrA (membrane-fusion protein)
MKLKKIALRGLIILAVTVALCMFFARTVMTITTPKVQIVQASRGRLEQKIKLSAQVYFPETTEHVLADAAKSAIVIDKVYVRPGHQVKAGETLFIARLSDYEKDMSDLQKSYDEKSTELVGKDIENRKAAKDSAQNDLYDVMMNAQTALAEAEHTARTEALKQGITFSPDMAKWTDEAAKGDAALKQAAAAVQTAKTAYDTAYEAFYKSFNSAKTRVSSNTFKYINERRALLKELAKISDDMVALTQRKNNLEVVTAPHAGYVVSMDVKSGDTYDGKKSAFSLSAENSAPVLRADITSLNKAVADGTRVDVAGDYGTEKTAVEKTVLESDGKKYVYITLTDNIISIKGGITRMVTDGSFDVSVTYRAKESSTLLPASAVRNEGEGQDYVYLIQRSWGGFLGASGMTVQKTQVTVLERGDKVVSIQQEMDYQEIADGEDRALTDGGRVMEYID